MLLNLQSVIFHVESKVAAWLVGSSMVVVNVFDLTALKHIYSRCYVLAVAQGIRM